MTRRRSIVAVVPVRVPVELVERVDALSEALDETRAQTIRRIFSYLPEKSTSCAEAQESVLSQIESAIQRTR